eukprot:4497358-Alexandrium_andersonii.AAC.1
MSLYLSGQGEETTFAVTMPESEVLFFPPAWLVCERAISEMNMGLRMSVLSDAHATVLTKVANVVSQSQAQKGA